MPLSATSTATPPPSARVVERDLAAFVRQRLRRVGDQVQEHLVDLRRRAGDRRYLAELLRDLDRLEHVPRQHRASSFEAVVQVEAGHLAAVEAAEVLEVADDLRHLAGAVQAVLDQPAQLFDHMLLPEHVEVSRRLLERARVLEIAVRSLADRIGATLDDACTTMRFPRSRVLLSLDSTPVERGRGLSPTFRSP